MEQFNINPEFRDKIPPLSEDEFKRLEENIVNDGEVREPLIVWNNTLIDGHHRWKIIQKHTGIPYKVKEMDFADKWAAIAWMCANQLGRRNITPVQKSNLIGEQAIAISKSRGGQIGNKNASKNESTETLESFSKKQKGHYSTATIIVAAEHKVNPATVQEAVQFSKGLSAADSVSPGFKEAVLNGEVKASKESIMKLRKLDDEERKKAVEAIENGTYKKPPKKLNYADGDTRKTYQLIRELSEDAGNIEKKTTYEIDNAVGDLTACKDSFLQQIGFVMNSRASTINESAETKAKVAKFIDSVIIELNKIKEEMK